MNTPPPVERPPVCRRACGHHHDGDPLDPATLISGPPCDGCRWCQAIAARLAALATPPTLEMPTGEDFMRAYYRPGLISGPD